MPFVLRGGNDSFRLRLADVLFKDVPVSIPIREEENRPAVGRPIPDIVIALHQREAPGVLHGFTA